MPSAPGTGGPNLVLVTAGLEADGGGRAAVGRLLLRAGADYASARGANLRVLSLRGTSGVIFGVPSRGFASRRTALALSVMYEQCRVKRSALMFDLLGLARVQGLLPRGLQSPYLVFLHGIEVWRPLGVVAKRAARLATVRLANSAYTRDVARRFLPPCHVDVLHLALEEGSPNGRRDEALLQLVGEGFLLMVSRLAASERYKGHDEVLEALPRVLRARPQTRLVIAGEGDDRGRLEAKAAALGLNSAVTFTGFVSQGTLAALYEHCAALVLPSRGEGFGLVYLEAMRAGKPCIAAAGTAAEEIVVHEKTGLLVNPDDPDALVAALLRPLLDPSWAEAAGQAGRQRWQEHFSYERFRNGLAAHLDRLTAC